MSEIKPITSKPVAKAPAKPKDTVIVVKFGFSEGLNFGCGFFIAGAIFTVLVGMASVTLVGLFGAGFF